jgi:thiosulfate/3-mercaptopyruvate sulfurtransferase
MLVNQSHTLVSVLDGGLDAWLSIGGSLTDTIPAPKRGAFSTRAWTRTVDRLDVRNRELATALIDARSPKRYTGDEERVDPKAGHIPGAISVPLTGNLNDDSTFLSPSQLRRRFAGLGLDDATHVISQCGSGVTACHNILAMTVAGMPTADLYVGSWSDWSAAGLPAATGERPR